MFAWLDQVIDTKLLYHLTSLVNLENILECGLLPRNQMGSELFDDVANADILTSRERHNLADFVPFHFFPRNPFDGCVQAMPSNRDKEFILITVYRILASNGDWKIIQQHPLADPLPAILDYDDGMEAIDWEAMDRRDYHDSHSKSVCMAECLSPVPVKYSSFVSIFVPNEKIGAAVIALRDARRATFHININDGMFLK